MGNSFLYIDIVIFLNMKIFFLIFLVFIFVFYALAQSDAGSDDDLVVQLVNPVGKIRGHVLKSAKGLRYYAFQEIPYAKPPVGELRFKAPREYGNWEGILNTIENTRVCPQIVSTTLPQNEDCLHLNVYTPVKPNCNKKLAVYVWIHGGGYSIWDNTIYRYGPQYLIDYDIIVVTPNYRLGAFGFLSTEDGVIPGNLGLRDQNLALRWVQYNIHKFGGDPNKVTIGGESAGSSSIGVHLLSSMSKGLYRAAILESGSAINTYNYQNRPNHYAFELGKLLDNNLVYGNSSALLEILQKGEVSEILEAQTKIVNVAPYISVIQDIVWSPVNENSVREEEVFLYKPRHESFINGDFNKVPILTGICEEEMLWFLPGTIQETVFDSPWDVVNKTIASLDEDPSRLINNKLNILDSEKEEVGSLIKKIYTNDTFSNDKPAYVKFAGDSYFNLGVLRQAQLTSQHVPVYLYMFAYTPLKKAFIQAAEHTEELQYFWHNVEESDVNKFQSILRHRMLKLWTNFIKYLNPTPKADEDVSNIIWPKLDPITMQYLNINKTLEVRKNPRKYLQLSRIIKKYLKPPMNVF